MSIEKKVFDKLGKISVYSYTIKNKSGAYVEIINFGARIRQIVVPDKDGNMSNVVTCCNTVKEYTMPGNEYYGAVIGRYANRIKGGTYTHNNLLYILTQNEGENHIHGGPNGFHNMIWTCTKTTEDTLLLEAVQPHGTEGYPGDLKMFLEYTFNDDNVLRLSLLAQSSKDTIFNPTNHSYFNLNTEGSDAGEHFLKIESREYMPVDKTGMPTGEILETPEIMDFSTHKRINTGLKNKKYSEDLLLRNGYDHNYVIKRDNCITTKAAELISVESGRKMEITTTAPGLQFYSGNFMKSPHTAVCLEPQYFPDSVHHIDDRAWAPMPFLEKGYAARFEVSYIFSVIMEEEAQELTMQK